MSLEPLYFANFLILPLWLMVYDFLFNKGWKNKWLAGLFVATSSLFILSLARSAILGMLVAGVIFVFGLGRTAALKKYLPTLVKAGGVIVIVAVAFVVASGVASKFIHKEAINGSDSGVSGNLAIFSGHALNVADESAQTRYATWPKAIDYIKERPLQGVGAYNSRVRLHLADYQSGKQDISLQPFNNDLLGLLVDLGLVGLVAFGPVLWASAKSLLRCFKARWRHPASAYVLALVAMLVQSNFFQSILLARLWFVVAVALTGLWALPTLKSKL